MQKERVLVEALAWERCYMSGRGEIFASKTEGK